MYINTATLERMKISEIKQALPNVSLPKYPTDEQLNPMGFAVLHLVKEPEGDVVTEGVPEQHIDGTWHQTWDIRNFTPEEEAEALEKAKQQATRRINRAYAQAMNAAVEDYPETERESWGKQEKEARDWIADNTSSTPFLDALLTIRTTLTKTELTGRIIAKADTLADLSGKLTGKRHVKEAEIEAAYEASDRATLEIIVW